MSHTKHTINIETERNPIFRNDSQLCEYETLFSIIEGFRQQKVGSCQVSLPLCLCAMLAHSGGLSVSPLQDWFMASISMFMRCHRPATKKKKEKKILFSLLLSKNGCCNAALRYRQTEDGVTSPSREDNSADIPESGDFQMSTASCVYSIQQQNLLGGSERALYAESLL